MGDIEPGVAEIVAKAFEKFNVDFDPFEVRLQFLEEPYRDIVSENLLNPLFPFFILVQLTVGPDVFLKISDVAVPVKSTHAQTASTERHTADKRHASANRIGKAA